MHTFIIGKNTQCLLENDGNLGIELYKIGLSAEEIGHMSCRIEQQFRYIYMIDGMVECQINQERVVLKDGEGVFINKNTMFRLAGSKKGDCQLYSLSADKKMREISFMENIEIPYVKLEKKNGEYGNILKALNDIGKAADEKLPCYQIEAKGMLYQICAILFREITKGQYEQKKTAKREAEKLRRMLVYLHEHYKDKITLTEIAENLGVSSGDYCRFFKKHMGQTPFEYLQVLRVEKTIPELLEKESNIAEFVLQHGFNGASYYAEIFRKEMGCSPGEYRKWYLDIEEMPCPMRALESTVIEEEPVKEPRFRSNIRQSLPSHLL